MRGGYAATGDFSNSRHHIRNAFYVSEHDLDLFIWSRITNTFVE